MQRKREQSEPRKREVRYMFAPVTPLPVAPLGRALFCSWGLRVMATELAWFRSSSPMRSGRASTSHAGHCPVDAEKCALDLTEHPKRLGFDTLLRMPNASTTPKARASACWIIERGKAQNREESLAWPQDGHVLVKTRFSGVSRGTERLVLQGRVPESEHERMRAPFQAGDFPFPVKYGYSNVGRVIAGPHALAGRDVFCLYPHQTVYVVPEAAVFPLPPHVPAARAVLAANMETALNAVWDAELRAGDRVAIVGAGVVGCLVAYLAARHPGVEATLVDVDQRKAKVASELGAHFATPHAAPRELDLVFHASGAPEGLTTALELAGQEARIVELSWYGDRMTTVPLGRAFHAKRLTIRSSQVGQLPPAQRPRWTHGRRLALALELLGDEALEWLITSECSFEELPRALEQMAGGDDFELCKRVVYDAARAAL